MAIVLYITALIAGIGLVAAAVRAWGTRPHSGRLAYGLLGSLLMTAAWMMLTVILHPEGNSSRIPLFLVFGAWALLSAIRATPRALFCSLGLFVYSIGLAVQHVQLATSEHYTDHPKARQSRVRIMRRAAARTGLTPPSEIHVRATGRTWITGLYAVDRINGEPGSAVDQPTAGVVSARAGGLREVRR